MLAFEEEKKDAEVGAIDPSNEVGEILEVRFNSRENIKRVLRSTEILSQSGTEKV